MLAYGEIISKFHSAESVILWHSETLKEAEKD